MEVIKLYQYGNSQSSKITPTPLLLSDEPIKYRIISDNKKILFEKEKNLKTYCIDILPTELWNWIEIDDDIKEEEEENYE